MATDFKLAAILEFANKAGPGIKSATKDLGGLEKVATAVGAAVTVAGVVAAGKAAYELGVLGAQSLRTKQAFAAISGGALIAADNLDAMRRATRGAMSEQDMMASANQLMQMGLANNAAELERVTMMATRLGSAMGVETGPAVAEFSLMLANQSIPRLDRFGISASRVRAHILELQKATPGLSREMAFMAATMEEGEAAMERLGETVDDELLANERLEASWADLKAMGGEALAPAMAEIAEVARDVITAMRDLNKETRELGGQFGEATVEAAKTEDIMSTLSGASGILAGEIDAVGHEAESAGGAMDALRQQMYGVESIALGRVFQEARAEAENMTPAIVAAGGAMDGLATSAKTVAGAFGEMEFDDEQLWKMAMASGASLDELSDLARILDIASEAEIQNTIEGYRLTEMFGAGALTAEQYAAGISALETATIDAAGGFEGLGADAAMAEKGLETMRTAQAGLADTTEDLGAKYGESGAELATAEAARNEAIIGARTLKAEEEGAARAADDLANAEGRAASEAYGMSDAVREVGEVALYRLSEAETEAGLKALGLQEELSGVTGEAGDAAKEVEILTGNLEAMKGIYTVTVVYEERGRRPTSPPGGWPGGGHQSGTAFYRGGPGVFGERGPELLVPPRGTRVYPWSAPETRAAVNNRYSYGGDTVYINDRLAAALYMEQRRRERMTRLESM